MYFGYLRFFFWEFLFRSATHFLLGLFGILMSSFSNSLCVLENSLMWGWWRFLSFCSLLCCLIDSVICLIEDFQFQKVPLINSWPQCLCYWCYIQEVVSSANALEALSHCLFYHVQCIWIFLRSIPHGLEFLKGDRYESICILLYGCI